MALLELSSSSEDELPVGPLAQRLRMQAPIARALPGGAKDGATSIDLLRDDSDSDEDVMKRIRERLDKKRRQEDCGVRGGGSDTRTGLTLSEDDVGDIVDVGAGSWTKVREPGTSLGRSGQLLLGPVALSVGDEGPSISLSHRKPRDALGVEIDRDGLMRKRCQMVADCGASVPTSKLPRRQQQHPQEKNKQEEEARGGKKAQLEEQSTRRVEAQQEKERERAGRQATAALIKAQRPEECMKHMAVCVDPGVLEAEGGGLVLSALQALESRCVIAGRRVQRSIGWRRSLPGLAAAEASSLESDEEEKPVVVVVPVLDFIAMVDAHKQQVASSGDSGCHLSLRGFVSTVMAAHPHCALTLAVVDVDKYFNQKTKGQKPSKESGERRLNKRAMPAKVHVSRVDMEEALVDLQLHTSTALRFLDSWKEFADFVAMFTKAIAVAPYKREREVTGLAFCVESEGAGGVRVDRDGRGYLQLWQRQLQQLNRVSAEMASAIVRAFPSPRLLLQAYARCGSDRERAALLADLLVRRGEGVVATSRRVGPELSRRVFLLVTSHDPQLLLEHGS
uniref:Crossover junction endonuclease EME1-like isoform X1 n=1 Tax=Petromyzon marinus TaxID=7757 RepID=A0AAJ7X0N8_PETMA|nr:crossover junction endonuclease EME1-like isoform X1 [Petromyzon marinus]XP_032816966.1 crossover junction endonuclease EME1-like isoform X1 [Petromyzon marinus]XP_032816967.1 crossover junction endonuclease EME1-like isoform X1 [Petromyzon marinus]